MTGMACSTCRHRAPGTLVKPRVYTCNDTHFGVSSRCAVPALCYSESYCRDLQWQELIGFEATGFRLHEFRAEVRLVTGVPPVRCLPSTTYTHIPTKKRTVINIHSGVNGEMYSDGGIRMVGRPMLTRTALVRGVLGRLNSLSHAVIRVVPRQPMHPPLTELCTRPSIRHVGCCLLPEPKQSILY